MIKTSATLAGALGNLGTILVREGQHEAALKLFQQGLDIHRNTGYRYGTAIALDNVGTAHCHLGNEREAQYYLRQAVQEARAIRADFIALDALVWLASLRAQRGARCGAGLAQHDPLPSPDRTRNPSERRYIVGSRGGRPQPTSH